MPTPKTTKKKAPGSSTALTASKKAEPKEKPVAVKKQETKPVSSRAGRSGAEPTPKTEEVSDVPISAKIADLIAPRQTLEEAYEPEMTADFISEEEEEDQSDEARARRPDRYFEGVGRRKSAIARVRLFTRAGDFSVNGKPYEQYFTTIELRNIVEDSLKKMKLLGRFRVSAKMTGGGMHGQAEALRHGLARCLVKFNPDFRKRLRRAGFMTRDPRVKERKKFGLKKARKAPQWAKR
jgi:small subunit ribosomal protein S9